MSSSTTARSSSRDPATAAPASTPACTPPSPPAAPASSGSAPPSRRASSSASESTIFTPARPGSRSLPPAAGPGQSLPCLGPAAPSAAPRSTAPYSADQPTATATARTPSTDRDAATPDRGLRRDDLPHRDRGLTVPQGLRLRARQGVTGRAPRPRHPTRHGRCARSWWSVDESRPAKACEIIRKNAHAATESASRRTRRIGRRGWSVRGLNVERHPGVVALSGLQGHQPERARRRLVDRVGDVAHRLDGRSSPHPAACRSRGATATNAA